MPTAGNQNQDNTTLEDPTLLLQNEVVEMPGREVNDPQNQPTEDSPETSEVGNVVSSAIDSETLIASNDTDTGEAEITGPGSNTEVQFDDGMEATSGAVYDTSEPVDAPSSNIELKSDDFSPPEPALQLPHSEPEADSCSTAAVVENVEPSDESGMPMSSEEEEQINQDAISESIVPEHEQIDETFQTDISEHVTTEVEQNPESYNSSVASENVTTNNFIEQHQEQSNTDVIPSEYSQVNTSDIVDSTSPVNAIAGDQFESSNMDQSPVTDVATTGDDPSNTATTVETLQPDFVAEEPNTVTGNENSTSYGQEEIKTDFVVEDSNIVLDNENSTSCVEEEMKTEFVVEEPNIVTDNESSASYIEEETKTHNPDQLPVNTSTEFHQSAAYTQSVNTEETITALDTDSGNVIQNDQNIGDELNLEQNVTESHESVYQENVSQTTSASQDNQEHGAPLGPSVVDDLGHVPLDSAVTQSYETQTNSLPQSSTNSFQSAFAAFASAATTSTNVAQRSEAMDVDEPMNETQQYSESTTSETYPTQTMTSETYPAQTLTSEVDSAQSMVSEAYTSQSMVSEAYTSQTMTSGIDSGLLQPESKKISILQMPSEVSSADSPVDSNPKTDDVNSISTQAMEESVVQEQQSVENQMMQSDTAAAEVPSDVGAASDAVYFIQMTDASGEIVTSIVDPNDIASYSDSVVYKQCMGPDGQIVTTIANSGGMSFQEEQGQQQQQVEAAEPESEQQVIYAHDLNGQLTPIDSAQSANDVAPPGKQFVYMQDSSGRIIRTIMDANQTMVPGQQVYYTQSEDGRIITSVMDSESTEEAAQPQQPQDQQQTRQQEQTFESPAASAVTQQSAAASSFAIDNSMSGLSMLAELSHLTSGQGSVELKGASNAESSTQENDLEEFRPVAMITKRVGEDGVSIVNSDMANLKVAQAGSEGPSESILAKLTAEIETKPSNLTLSSVCKDNLFVQWQNLDAMCWMDVVLIMLVYSPSLQPLVNLDPSNELASTLLITLLKANRQAQILLQNLLKRSSGAETSTLQNGAGNQDAKTSKLVCKENMDEIGKAINILYAMREQIWKALQPRLRCERGKHNSPVLVLPLLVREKPIIKQMFTMNFRYVFKCNKCGYSQDDSHSKILPTIPAVPANFNMKDPCFVRNCFECQAPDQRMLMKFEGLQDFVQIHFVKGLPHNRFDELSFDHGNDHYEVTAVVHYKNNPDHFIAWVRNAPGNTWMECDDLKSVITRYQNTKPNIPPSQVHMVMWERRLAPKHTMVMKDTEDTKLLASLVLTVQQPGGAQTSQESAGKPSAPPATSTLSTTGMAQGPASSFLSGLITQSQQSATNFSPYTPRGRGRGSRGSRGSRGGRGNSVTIRRGVTSINNQMMSPGISTAPRAGSPQIIRLPISALQGMGTQLRGSSGANPSQRFILMGGNNSTAQPTQTTTSSTPSKVVVVRSQGGSAGLNQLSATQLLQLLQRTGAITNSNTRITTTISRPGSDGTTQQQTITLTPEAPTGQGTAATATTATSASSGSVFQTGQTTLGGAEPVQLDATASAEGATAEEASQQETSMDVDPADEESHMSQAIPATPSGKAISSEAVNEAEAHPATSLNSVSILSSSESPAQPKMSTVSINSGALRNLSRTALSDGNRYVQIPNPKGGPNIMTQLVVRGDKMVLVPVDKSAQSQAASSSPSVLRLSTSSTQAASPLTTSLANLGQVSSPITASLPTTTVSGGAASQTTRYITIPGQGSGGKRTIQLISVPRGSASTTGVSPSGHAKTFIVGNAGTQTRVIPQSQEGDASLSQQQANSNIVVREVKPPNDGPSAASTPTVAVSLSEGTSTQTPLAGASSTVSLLKSVGPAALEGSQAVSILSSAAAQTANKAQESFKYILPGSNSQQMASIQTLGGAHINSKAFTALSSSGTIIGGQLTTVNANTSDVTPSPVESVDAAVQSLYPELESIGPTIPTQGRGRGRGRGGRGRGRGARTPRGGRGGRQQLLQQQLANQVVLSQVQTKVVGRSGTISMLPADFHRVGGQIIETSTESVDGAPVVSIPDFTMATMQSESQAPPEPTVVCTATNPDPLAQPVDTATMSSSSSSTIFTSMASSETTADPSAAGGHSPRVITQPIPSIKANHGFDILTQGILGSINNPSNVATTPRKTGISLLTGKTVSSPPLSNIIASPPFTADVSRMQQTLAMGHSISQSEIDTLIMAAQGAAKPPKPGQRVDPSDSDSGTPATHNVGEENKLATQEFNVDDFLSAAKGENKSQETAQQEEVKMDDTTDSKEEELHANVGIQDSESTQFPNVETAVSGEQESNVKEAAADTPKERVFSVDESQVSAAERYRMPTELFQPDEESPEKPVRSELVSSHMLEEDDLPAKLFNESADLSSKDVEMKSPDQKQTMAESECFSNVDKEPSSVTEGPTVEEQSLEETDNNRLVEDISSVVTSNEVVNEEQSEATTTPTLKKARGRPKGKGRKLSHGKGVTSKNVKSTSGSLDLSEGEDQIASVNMSPPPPPQSSLCEKIVPIISSPKNESNLVIGNTQQEEQKVVLPSVGEFADDILRETEKRELAEKICSEDNKLEENLEDKKDEIKEEIKLDTERKMNDIEVEEKRGNKENKPPVRPAKVKCQSPEAHISHKKQKIDWNEEKEVNKKTCVFSYQYLTKTRKKPSRRHPSLGPRPTSYTNPPIPMVSLMDKEDLHELLLPVVKRRRPGPLERPNVDPSKEPAVIPLVPEEDADPACSCGGSVVTGHKDGEIFTGVVVRHRREVADWSSSNFEDEEFTVEIWEDIESRMEFIETMWTAMCMDVRFVSWFEEPDSGVCDFSEEEASCGEDDLSESNLSKSVEAEESVMETDELREENDCEKNDSDAVPPTDGGGKRKVEEENSVVLEDSKRMRLTGDLGSNDEMDSVTSAPTSLTQPSPVSTTTVVSEIVSTTVTSPPRLNGISQLDVTPKPVVSVLPFHQSTTSSSSIVTPTPTTSSSTSSSSLSTTKKQNTSSNPAFISPARRSSRTPVPSLKVRDSLEEGIPANLKTRRSSLVSSDDDMSGYSSDEIAVKKKIKKIPVQS